MFCVTSGSGTEYIYQYQTQLFTSVALYNIFLHLDQHSIETGDQVSGKSTSFLRMK